MSGTLGSLVVSLEANIARFTSDMGRAAQQTEQTMQRINASTLQTQQAMQRLDSSAAMVKASLMGIAGGATIGGLISLSDAAATVTGKIRMVTDSFSELKSVQAQLLATAQQTRQSFEATADLYSKVTRAADGLNLTQKDMVKFTGAVNNALVVSAAGAQQSEAAILQLGQAVASGKLAGDEFKSISENAPRLIQAIADGMGVSRGQMKQYATDGKLTAEVITQAIIGQFGKLEVEAAKMPVTIGQSFQRLRNVIVDYMTSTSETSKVADAVASAVTGITNNLDKLEAVVAGLVSYKLAAWTLEIASALVVKANAAYTTAGALSTERFATIAAAEANVVAAESEVARIAAKAAFIAELRAEQVATVALANSIMLNSYSSAANTLALQSRSAAMVELAALGRAQIAVEAATTAATAASTAATAGLTAARVAGAGGGAMAAAGALLMANPITAVTAVLGLGIAAWMAWGDSAKESEKKAAVEVEKSTVDIISDLDKQIKKLQERNALSASGLKGIAKSSAPESDRMSTLKSQMDAASAGTGDYAGLDQTARSDILLKLGMQYGELYSKIQTVAVEKDKLEGKTNSEKLEAWLEKNEQYLSKAQQLALKLKKAKADLGDSYTPKIEAAITADFNKGDKKEASTESAKLAKKTLDGQLKDLEEGLAQQRDELDFGNRYMAELRRQDIIDQTTYNDYRKLAFESSVSISAKAYDAEIAQAEKYRDSLKKGSDREEAQTRIDTLKAKREKAVQDAQQATAMQTLELNAAQSDLNKSMQEWIIQQDQAARQFQFEIDMFGKSTLEVAKLTAARRIQLDVEERIRQAKKNGDISDETVAKIQADAAIAKAKSDLLYDKADAKQKDPWANMQAAVNRYGEDASNVGAQIGNAMTDAFKSSEDAFVNFAVTGKLSFTNLANSIIADMARMAAKQALSPLFSYLGSAVGSYFNMPSTTGPGSTGWDGYGNTLAGARATGGPVSGGSSYLVGERGPEIFTPPSGGTIIPNSAIGSSGGIQVNTSITLSDSGASSQTSGDSSSKGRALADLVNAQIKDVLMRETRQGGILWNQQMRGFV